MNTSIFNFPNVKSFILGSNSYNHYNQFVLFRIFRSSCSRNRQTTYIWNKSYGALRQRLLLSADAEHNTPEGTGGGIWLLTCSSSESFQLLSCCAEEFMICFQKSQHSLVEPASFFLTNVGEEDLESSAHFHLLFEIVLDNI